MTKYILIGGYPNKAFDGGKSMCDEAIKDLSGTIRVLICLFARPESSWFTLFEENKEFFIKNLNDTGMKFTLAKPNEFIKQLDESDVIYFVGGDTKLLKNILKRKPTWTKHLESKTVIGSSAGTDMLSKYNFDLEYFRCSQGYDLVPVKTMVHFKSKDYTPPKGWRDAVSQLEKYREIIPVWLLKEGEHRVYNDVSRFSS